jgi:hypothetical protein
MMLRTLNSHRSILPIECQRHRGFTLTRIHQEASSVVPQSGNGA